MFEILTHHFSFMVCQKISNCSKTMVGPRSCSSATLNKKKEKKDTKSVSHLESNKGNP